MPRIDILEQEDKIRAWIADGQTKTFIAQQLKCKPETLNAYLKKLNIEYAGQPGSHRNEDSAKNTSYRPAIYYIDNNIPIKSHRLKEKMLRDGLKEEKCELCGLTMWQGVKIPLELHHKNGDHYDNSLNNLQILCPNCHALQENNSGANIGNYSKNYCIDCGKEISARAIRCEECYHKSTKGKLKISLEEMVVTRDELKNLIRTNSFVQIGNQFGVTDNTIRKWCDKYNLPRRVSEIKIFSDEEWEKL